MGTLPGRKPSILMVRASFFKRDCTSDSTIPTGKVNVILRSSFSSVSTVTAMVILLNTNNGRDRTGRYATADCPANIQVVRGGGLEPPHCFQRQDLNLVRLPISPPAQKTKRPVCKTSPGKSVNLEF